MYDHPTPPCLSSRGSSRDEVTGVVRRDQTLEDDAMAAAYAAAMSSPLPGDEGYPAGKRWIGVRCEGISEAGSQEGQEGQKDRDL